MIETVSAATTTARPPEPFARISPVPQVRDYLDFWQRELDLTRDLAATWTAALKWMGSWYIQPWPGSIGGVRRAVPPDLEAAQPAHGQVVGVAADVTGEAFDEAVHLLVYDDLSVTVKERTTR